VIIQENGEVPQGRVPARDPAHHAGAIENAVAHEFAELAAQVSLGGLAEDDPADSGPEGKSILVSREALNSIGGIEALRDHLAEDYLLGRMIAGAGYRVVLSGDEIETTEVSRSLSAAWSRQRRWAILRKRLGGPCYAAELLASPLPWFAGVLLAARNEPGLVACAAALYLLRIGLEAFTAARSGGFSAADWLLAPLRDLAAAVLFWAGLFGSRTSWRGRSILVGRNTLIVRAKAASGRLVAPAHQAAEQG